MRLEGVLAEIVERTLAEAKSRVNREDRRDLIEAGRSKISSRRGFERSLRADPRLPTLICEIKKASPSKGVLAADLDPRTQAEAYTLGGASAVSVVTEPHYFQGSLDFLDQARSGGPSMPLLRKDFIVHEFMILETAATTADALLLLTTALSPTQLKDYIEMADAFGLDQLVEVNDTREAETALKAGARVIGVNNRDLRNFEVTTERTKRVLPVLEGTGVVPVTESGIHDPEIVGELFQLGAKAFLVGEALVRASDPARKIQELRGSAP